MRDELTKLGVKELRTPQEVEQTVKQPGTTLVFVNSVCGCAAAGARPGLELSLLHGKKPDRMVTVFAGMEAEAVAKAREFFKPYRPSSPQIGLLKNGALVHMIQRQDIEGRDPAAVAKNLTDAFDKHC
jgi:putative YphP/YqiW family bacilliredoxin